MKYLEALSFMDFDGNILTHANIEIKIKKKLRGFSMRPMVVDTKEKSGCCTLWVIQKESFSVVGVG